jgi:hypothetical protein
MAQTQHNHAMGGSTPTRTRNTPNVSTEAPQDIPLRIEPIKSDLCRADSKRLFDPLALM